MIGNDPANLPAAYARELISIAQRFDVPADDLLSDLGYTLPELEQPALRIPLTAMETLVKRAHRLTGEPGLAFYMGLQMRLSLHGFLGFAAMTAHNLRDALSLAERYSRTRTTALSLRLNEEGELGSFTLEEHVELNQELREFLVIALFLGIAQLAQALTGKKLTGAVDVTFSERPHYERFAHLVPGDIRFERAANRIVFPAEYLTIPIVTADPVATQLAREQCERELSGLGEGIKLIDQIRALLSSTEGEAPTVEEMAKRLYVSTRTLKRKLTEHGTSFTKIVDGHLRRQALLLMEDPRLTIEEVAARLGYSDAANFARAFKRWTGSAPGAFRRDK